MNLIELYFMKGISQTHQYNQHFGDLYNKSMGLTWLL